MGQLNQPVAFAGSTEEALANRQTHCFGHEARCLNCDCRPFGRVANWPCGVKVPREIVEQAEGQVDYLTAATAAFVVVGALVVDVSGSEA